MLWGIAHTQWASALGQNVSGSSACGYLSRALKPNRHRLNGALAPTAASAVSIVMMTRKRHRGECSG